MPNEILDHAMAGMSRAEWVILTYLVRQCWRFKSSVVAVSYNQFKHGLRVGSERDRGTGLASAGTISRALKSLEAGGYLCVRSYRDGDGQTHNVYALQVEGYGRGEVIVGHEFPNGSLAATSNQRPGAGSAVFTSKRQWSAIKQYYGSRCVDCGRHESEVALTRDHIIPSTRGGPNTADNIVPRCRSCNARKGNRPVPLTDA